MHFLLIAAGSCGLCGASESNMVAPLRALAVQRERPPSTPGSQPLTLKLSYISIVGHSQHNCFFRGKPRAFANSDL